MSTTNTDKLFTGPIPELYERHLVPMIFQPYADDMAARVAERKPSRILEIAAGTGAVTRAMAKRLPDDVELTATDLNAPMLARAEATGVGGRKVQWRQADAMQLPFDDGSFDLVVCQFGVMFFPDKAKAFAEARRVLRPGGTLLFNVWDRIDENEFANAVSRALAECFPESPPDFMARTPHGYHQREVIERDLAAGGFAERPRFDTVAKRSRAESAQVPAIGFCQATPMRAELEGRGGDALQRATHHCEAALRRQFGEGQIEGRISAHVIEATA
ncbi:class I SAM-dependent methyltransferase [Cupriavidus sp. AU9028]|uniref:class I SAM-dependent methyltransferase n=1 Tax=Cupriavidus sp. AU9028 TaxID=2871157 RepID=UPI001C955944|nr:class I SAM-dependent methyltransferase [Cupriavidus sp. AU9028]MBY4897135.1 methyltransferase domain-containing protein [Cupriavidus sp. AU9028]